MPRVITLLLLMTMILPGKAKEVREFKTALGKQAAERAWKPQGRWDRKSRDLTVSTLKNLPPDKLQDVITTVVGEVGQIDKEDAPKEHGDVAISIINRFLDERSKEDLQESPTETMMRVIKGSEGENSKYHIWWDKEKKNRENWANNKEMGQVARHAIKDLLSGDVPDYLKGKGYEAQLYDHYVNTDVMGKPGFKRKKWMDAYGKISEGLHNMHSSLVPRNTPESKETWWPRKAWGGEYDRTPAVAQYYKDHPEKLRNLPQWATKRSPLLRKLKKDQSSQNQNARGGSPGGQSSRRKTYTIQEGGSLSRAGQEVGVPWRKIYEANKEKVGPDPNKVSPGTELVIPQGQ